MTDSTVKPSSSHRPDVTGPLLTRRDGDAAAFAPVHAKLRQLAHRELKEERPEHTLLTADLVHERYLRLVDANRVRWTARAQFLAVAAPSMRRILVDAARAWHAQNRGGDQIRVPLDAERAVEQARGCDLSAIDEGAHDARGGGRATKPWHGTRSFGSVTVEETAEALNVSPETVMRDWKVARAWLFNELAKG